MPRITIDGQVHEAIYVERDEKGRCGIVTDEQTFWLKPVCGFKGDAVEEWPKMPPAEITAVSLNETNAPKSFIQQLLTEWQKFRRQWMASTPKERGELVGMFMGHDRYGGRWIRPDHKTPDLSWRKFKNSWFNGRRMVVMMGMRARGLRDDQVERELAKVCYLATYPDQAGTLIFLEAVEASAHSREEAQEVRARLAESEGDLRVSKTSEPANAEARAKPVYRITFVGSKRWKITFGTYEPFFVTDNGIGRELAYVLKHPHTEFHVLDVQHMLTSPTRSAKEIATTKEALDAGLSLQSGTHRIQRSKLKAEQYAEIKQQLEAELEAAHANCDQNLVAEVEEKLERLEKYQAEALHPEKDWAKACNDRFRAGLKRFKDAVAVDRTPSGKAFLAHLEKHLTLARFKFHYHPPEGFNWTD